MKIDDSAYKGLIEVAKSYNDTLKALNTQTISLMQNDSVKQMLKACSVASNQLVPQMDTAVLGIAKILEKSIPSTKNSPDIVRSIQGIAYQYKELFGSYDFTPMAESMRVVLEKSQLTSIAQLCLSHETAMIHDTIGCFANARYEYLPDVLNQAMAGSTIGAADVAFLKTGAIIPIIESELKYPRGFKTSVSNLRKSTAEDIADNPHIEYDTRENKFIGSESKVDSKSMNIVCAGIEVFGSDDLFTEVELMNFVSYLSRTPMGGGFNETGIRIHQWLEEIYSRGINIMSFDHELYYHSRSRRGEDAPYTFDEMLKAPYGLPGAGRFNQVGRAHYYFANTRKGAETEVKRHLKKDEVLQTVKIRPKRQITLLDLSGTLQRGASFLKMIRFPLKDFNNKMPKEYLLPCYVADCCQLIGIEGIKYYGSKEYVNYVCWDDGYFTDAGMCE